MSALFKPIARGLATVAAVSTGALAFIPTAAAAVPAPCGGVAQISDATGDGHHNNTDVLSAWFSEQAGRLQAVIGVRVGAWEPAHDDSDAAGFALLFDAGGVTRYVRAEAPRNAPARYDHGTWTAAEGFVSAGSTGGATEGTNVTIDVPDVATGALLSRSFVLTYDGRDGGEIHWVDRAPGGTTPAGDEFGGDYVVGSCATAPPGPSPGPGAPAPSAYAITAVQLQAPKRLVGGGRAKVSGRVLPARGGVSVALVARAKRSATRTMSTKADGSFALSLPISETTRLHAVAGGIRSQTLTTTVRSTVRIAVRRLAGGAAEITGRVRPALPGRVLLLRTDSVAPTRTVRPRRGRFRIRLVRPRRGRYQAVYIPSGRRAERSTSNTGVIR